jgi:TPR repeat protein
MVNLGWCYDTGLGVRKNVRRALQLYIRAARLKEAAGCLNAGITYRSLGKRRQARYWLRRAAALGDEDGELMLLEMTVSGKPSSVARAAAIAGLRRLSRSDDGEIRSAALQLLTAAARQKP